MWRRVLSVTIALAGLATLARSFLSVPETSIKIAPVVERERGIPDKYIVVFGNGMRGPDVPGMPQSDAALARDAVAHSKSAERTADALGASIGQAVTVGYRYRWAVIGFSVNLPRAQIEVLRTARGVSWIESDDEILSPPSPPAYKVYTEKIVPRIRQYAGRRIHEQANAPIGLDRLGQRLSELNGRYFWSSNGSGVHVYVVDTGILTSHADLRGRVRVAPGQWYNATSETLTPSGCSRSFHGTRVASIIGGTTYGVAKAVTMHPVIVFGCAERSSNATITAGVEWVLKHYSTAAIKFPAVANLSLEVPVADKNDTRDALFRAVANSIQAGITFTVAAGNGGRDACFVTPARVPGAITIASTQIWDNLDLKADDSNFGTCVDAFAPGVQIKSAVGPGNFDVADGPDKTSFAAPQAAGIVAMYLQNHRGASPGQVRDALFAVANSNSKSGWCGVYLRGPGSPNALLHWGAGSNDGKTDVEAEPPTRKCPDERLVWFKSRTQ